MYSQVSTLFNGSSSNSVSQQLDTFLNDVNSLTTTPQDLGLRTTVLADAKTLASTFNQGSTGVSNIRSQVAQDAGSTVSQVNQLLSQLASTNVSLDQTQMPAAQNQDRQAAILNQLSSLINVQVINGNGGVLTVYQGGTPIVYGTTARTLSLTTDTQGNQVLTTDNGRTLTSPGGQMGAQLDALNTVLPALSQNLNTVASQVMGATNQIVTNSYDLYGQPGAPLFSGIGAGDMSVAISDPSALALATASLTSTTGVNANGSTVDSSATLASQSGTFATSPSGSGVVNVNGTNITWSSTQSLDSVLSSFSAAGVNATFDPNTQTITLARNPSIGTGAGITVTDVSGNFTAFTNLGAATLNNGVPGDGGGATALAGLSSTVVVGTPPTQSLPQSVSGFMSSVAQSASQAQNDQTTAQSLLTSLQQQQDSQEGVNQDEEAANMMSYQQTYEAAVELAHVQDQMLNTLINNTLAG